MIPSSWRVIVPIFARGGYGHGHGGGTLHGTPLDIVVAIWAAGFALYVWNNRKRK